MRGKYNGSEHKVQRVDFITYIKIIAITPCLTEQRNRF